MDNKLGEEFVDVPVQRGVTFGFRAPNGYLGSDQAKRSIDSMLEAKVKDVVLTPIVLQETSHTTRQYRDFSITPNDHHVYQIIEYMHSVGLNVTLRPMIETEDGNGRLQVWFAGDRDSRIPGRFSDHWKRWFESMCLRSIHYARIAQEMGCARYGLDSELDRTVGQHENWKQVIAAVREVFDGAVTSCHTTHTRIIDWEKELENPDHWWRDLDHLEFSCYEPGAVRPDTPLEEMVEQLVPIRNRFRALAHAYGKPIAFGECGCTSTNGGATCPSSWSGTSGTGCYDGEEQARYLEAVLTLFWEEPWWAGIYWWKWDEHVERPQFAGDPAGDKGFTVVGKPAMKVMERFFGREDRLGARLAAVMK